MFSPKTCDSRRPASTAAAGIISFLQKHLQSAFYEISLALSALHESSKKPFRLT